MAITVPSAGDAITAAWGESVADALNDLGTVIVAMLAADVSKTGNTYSDITGLTFACTSGREYAIEAWGTYSTGGTSTGIGLGFNHPGGDARGLWQVYGVSSSTASSNTWHTTTDDTSGDATVDSANPRLWVFRGRYQCTSSGTFALRYKRNGTSTTTTVEKGSIIIAHSVA